MTNQLAFRDIQFNVVNHNNQIWLTSKELAKALKYSSAKSVTDIYNNNSDEFSQVMSLVVKSTTNGINGSKRRMKVRVFSLRGAHLIAMFARTPVAKEFRRWVLDILDKEAGNTQTEITLVNVASPEPTTADHRYHVKVIIRDNLFGSCVEMLGKADSFKAIANGIATDLGYRPNSFTHIPASKEKIKRIY